MWYNIVFWSLSLPHRVISFTAGGQSRFQSEGSNRIICTKIAKNNDFILFHVCIREQGERYRITDCL